jgi:DNA (cytosine-5)-methyltransferase 1
VSLFSGVGGFDLALERAGFQCILQVELDDAARAVLAARWPHVERAGDVRHVLGVDRSVDVLVAGFPCQDLSVAGKRAGLDGERSGLFWEIVRLAQRTRPTWGLLENVPGLLSSAGGRDMGAVLRGLRQCWPCIGWRVLDSRFFGVPQRRRRIFLVGGPDEARVAQVLFESARVPGHPAARGQARAGAAPALAGGAHAACFNIRGRDDGARVELSDVASVRAAQGGSSRSYVTERLAEGALSHALTRTMHKKHDGDTDTLIVADTLNTGGAGGGFRSEPGAHLVTQAWGLDADLADPISAVEGRTYTHEGRNNFRLHNVVQAPTVRRLTPTECERLQGFPDGWTCLCQPLATWSLDPEGTAEVCRCGDSARYRMMGNAVTVPVVEWLGHRLKAVL